MLWFVVILCLTALTLKTHSDGIQDYKIRFNIPPSCRQGFVLMNPDNKQILQFSPIHAKYSPEITVTISDGCYLKSNQDGCVIEGTVSTLGLYRVIPNDITKLSCNKTFLVEENVETTSVTVSTLIARDTSVTHDQDTLDTTAQPTENYSFLTTENLTTTRDYTYRDDSTNVSDEETSPLYIILGGLAVGLVLVMTLINVPVFIYRKRRQPQARVQSDIHTVNRSADNRNFAERTLTSRCSERYRVDYSVHAIEDEPVYMEIDNCALSDEVVTYDYVTNHDLKQRGDTSPKTTAFNEYYLTPVNGKFISNLAAEGDDYIQPVNCITNPKTGVYETLQSTSSDECAYHCIRKGKLLQKSK